MTQRSEQSDTDLLRLQGEARLAVKQAMGDLREALDFADVKDEPGFRTAIRLNNLAHRVQVETRNFGRLLP